MTAAGGGVLWAVAGTGAALLALGLVLAVWRGRTGDGMRRYRSKPTVVEAAEWSGSDAEPYVHREVRERQDGTTFERFYVESAISTMLDGQPWRRYLQYGDWVVKDGDGYYPVNGQQFLADYDPA